MKDLAQAVDIVQRGQRFLLTCHVLPDPDAIGSMMGLAAILRSLGKEVYLYNRDPVPESLSFLADVDEIHSTLVPGMTFDATMVTDTAARNLLPRQFPPAAVTGPVIMVDHHFGHDDFGDLVLRDVNAAATAVVVHAFAKALGVDPIPAGAAEPLYTALVADTGGFRYTGTTPDTLRMAADFLDKGVDPWNVASHVFEHWPMARLRLLGYAINAIETEHAGRIAIMCIPLTMVQKAGATEQMVEGMVEYGRMLQGVEISIMLWERRPRSDETAFGSLLTRLSMRSAGNADVARVATALGGGGHRTAAGATLSVELKHARERVLEQAALELKLAP